MKNQHYEVAIRTEILFCTYILLIIFLLMNPSLVALNHFLLIHQLVISVR